MSSLSVGIDSTSSFSFSSTTELASGSTSRVGSGVVSDCCASISEVASATGASETSCFWTLAT